MMIVMAFFEVIGVASILPFLAVLSNPEIIQSQAYMSAVYHKLGFTSPRQFLLALGLVSFALLVASTSVRVATMFIQNRFLQMRRHSIGCRLMRGYLSQKYEFFLYRHTGDLGRNILSEVDVLVDRALLPMGMVISYFLVLLAMISFLLIVNPIVTACVAGSLLGVYLLAYRIVTNVLHKSGHARAQANRVRFEVASEAFVGVKALKILNREEAYLHRFSEASELVSNELSLSLILGQLPKYVVETLAFGGIMLGAIVVLWWQGASGDFGAIIPTLSLYAFAGYKMLPAIQGIYGNMTSSRFATAAVENVSNELDMIEMSTDAPPAQSVLPLRQTLELRRLCYSYPGTDVGLQDISFELRRGETLGIVGRTGSGKTTLVDVLMGLLSPTSGSILVDGVELDDRTRRRWQKGIGYVPQDIFLVDASVAENIALGLDPGQIDDDRVTNAAHLAQIYDFVEHELPEGFSTRIGDRGVRLSGGQRQRIGIARALYNDPDLIVFDEATSALDGMTESEVMNAIQAFAGQKTIILIAHRTATLATCDKILNLESGRIVDVRERSD